MEVKASLKYLRISPRKVRLVANLIKGLPVNEAELQLKNISKRSAEPLLKLLKSAISNAEHNFQLDRENLYIKSLRVNSGPTLKRYMPRARGVAYEIKKRTSHIDIILEEIKPSSEKKQKVEKEIKEETSKKELKKKTAEPKIEKAAIKEQKAPKQVLAKQRIFRRKAI